MSDALQVDLFVEDSAHEEFLKALAARLAREEGKSVAITPRSARGGHPRALGELGLYQTAVRSGMGGLKRPDLLIVAIDANCDRYAKVKMNVEATIDDSFKHLTVVACPDPHIERWYLTDPASFHTVVGATPRVGKKKCERDHYKRILARTIRAAGHPPTLGGIEFAREIVDAMDLYRAAKADKALKDFVQTARSAIRRAGSTQRT